LPDLQREQVVVSCSFTELDTGTELFGSGVAAIDFSLSEEKRQNPTLSEEEQYDFNNKNLVLYGNRAGWTVDDFFADEKWVKPVMGEYFAGFTDEEMADFKSGLTYHPKYQGYVLEDDFCLGTEEEMQRILDDAVDGLSMMSEARLGRNFDT